MDSMGLMPWVECYWCPVLSYRRSRGGFQSMSELSTTAVVAEAVQYRICLKKVTKTGDGGSSVPARRSIAGFDRHQGRRLD